MSITVLNLKQVQFNSAAPTLQMSAISFTPTSAVSGVSASYHRLLFAPGSYTVQINLPPGYGGGADIAWSSAPPKPSGGTTSSGLSWVKFDIVNSLATGSVVYSFSLHYTTTGFTWCPHIASDPPPTLVFQSS